MGLASFSSSILKGVMILLSSFPSREHIHPGRYDLNIKEKFTRIEFKNIKKGFGS